MHTNTVTLEKAWTDMPCPYQSLVTMRFVLFETFDHHCQRSLGGDDILAALAGRPAAWIIPLFNELSWCGTTTSHCVIDADGKLTGDRVWLEDPVEDDVRPEEYALVPHPDYEEVQVGVRTNGDSVIVLDGGDTQGVWRSAYFAILKRDLQLLMYRQGTGK